MVEIVIIYGLAQYSWIFAFGTAGISDGVAYGIYIDADHLLGSGGTTGPLPFNKKITVDNLYLPDYVLYITPAADAVVPSDVMLYTWTGTQWDPGKSLTKYWRGCLVCARYASGATDDSLWRDRGQCRDFPG